ncbi:MAG: BREX system ATP-binding protein BrxD [Candidatus Xenobia bacterium]
MKTDIAIAIVTALRQGTVPSVGLEYLAVGVDKLHGALSEQRDWIARGNGCCRFIRGGYGSGKTFLTSLEMADAMGQGFACSRVVISMADTRLYRLAEVYRRICQGLSIREHPDGGALSHLLDRWLYGLEQQVIELDKVSEDDPKFVEKVGQKVDATLKPIGERAGRLAAALKSYYQAQYRADYVERQGILDWLSGEARVPASIKKIAGIMGQVADVDALDFLRGWLELLRSTNYKGLVVVLDEAEVVLRLRKPEREKSFEVIRQLVDACDKKQFPGLQVLVTGTPELFDSDEGVPSLKPLHERILVRFSDDQPDNVQQAQVRLHPFDAERLHQAALKVRSIYPARRCQDLTKLVTEDFVSRMIEQVATALGGHIDILPRLFLREFINILDLCDQETDYDPTRNWSFKKSLLVDLREEERILIAAADGKRRSEGTRGEMERG